MSGIRTQEGSRKMDYMANVKGTSWTHCKHCDTSHESINGRTLPFNHISATVRPISAYGKINFKHERKSPVWNNGATVNRYREKCVFTLIKNYHNGVLLTFNAFYESMLTKKNRWDFLNDFNKFHSYFEAFISHKKQYILLTSQTTIYTAGLGEKNI